MSKPSILIVGGAYHPEDYLKPLAKTFEDAGYPATTVGLPSAGQQPPATDFSGDVAAIRAAAEKIVAEKKDFIAVLHSLGGIAGTEALHGLDKKSTGGNGLLAIAYIASIVPKKGTCFDDHMDNVGEVAWKPARAQFTQNGTIFVPPEYAQFMFYTDIEDAEAKRWVSLLVPQSVGVYDSPLTKETFREVPSGYMYTTKDQAFKHEYQLKTVEWMGSIPKEKTTTLETGHNPWLVEPEKVRDWVISVAN